MKKIIFILGVMLMTTLLQGCGDAVPTDVNVTGGVSSTFDVNVGVAVATTLADGRQCLKIDTGNITQDGSCTDPVLILEYDLTALTIADMNAVRDFATLPCTPDERTFLTNTVCGPG